MRRVVQKEALVVPEGLRPLIRSAGEVLGFPESAVLHGAVQLYCRYVINVIGPLRDKNGKAASCEKKLDPVNLASMLVSSFASRDGSKSASRKSRGKKVGVSGPQSVGSVLKGLMGKE